MDHVGTAGPRMLKKMPQFLLLPFYFSQRTVLLTIDKIATFGFTPVWWRTITIARRDSYSQKRSSRRQHSITKEIQISVPLQFDDTSPIGSPWVVILSRISHRIVVVNDSGVLLYYPQSVGAPFARTAFTFYRVDCLKGALRKINIIFLRGPLFFRPFFPGRPALTSSHPSSRRSLSRSGKDDCDEQPSGRSQTRAI